MANPELQLANDFVQHTGCNIFLTGKAGTGKTTFLHKLKQDTHKRMIVTAPTGVAAINAGGVTIHSFFQLPFGPYMPEADIQQQHRISREKINIIKSLDLLVIDEISMVRADLLDGIDAVLRRYKHHHLPFGGVQLLMIGDLHQLSPVVKDDEWNLLKTYYDTCYFFSSNALRQTEMVSIELKQVYRQSDAQFIHLLNRVRENRLDRETIESLNTRYIPSFQPDGKDNYITLTTHNRSANNINDKLLQRLNSTSFTFQAEIEDDYPPYSYPTTEKLKLKKGAQVMFVRNDSSTDKLYFNGKIGKVTDIDQHSISVKCPDDEQAILVEQVTWENIKYTVDAKSKEITEQVLGTFTQYPLRLAWAITIHKSQGLTFERAIIDANAAFSHGQVYVALSRCKTFEGMVLSTPITQSAVKTDTAVAQFVEHADHNTPTGEKLNHATILYQQSKLLECFDYRLLASSLRKLTGQLRENHSTIQCVDIETIDAMQQQFINDVISVADKFKRQLRSLFKSTLEYNKTPNKTAEDDPHIQERVRKASSYFTDILQEGLAKWLSAFHFDTDNKETRKQINKAFELLQYNLAIKTACLHCCRQGFSTRVYLNAIAHAEVNFQSRSSSKKQSADVSTADLKHPALFQALMTWRKKQAKEEQVEHYRVLHQRILVQIAEALPNTIGTLLQTKGVGKHTANKYGEQLIALVNDYCLKHHIEPQQTAPKPFIDKKIRIDTKRISYELFLKGKDIKQIADHRMLVTSTVEGHLAYYVGLGQLDITELISDKKINVIQQAFDEHGRESLKNIKEYLGDEFSYGEIRLVGESLEYRGH